MATIKNYTIFIGDTREFNGTVKDEAGTAVNIGIGTIEWVLGDGLITKTTEDGSITVTSALNGEYTFTLTADETADLSGQYTHQSDLIDSEGNRTTIVTGTIAFVEYVTLPMYATVEEADVYFAQRLFVDTWNNSTTDTKQKALYMATLKIDAQPLNGRKADLEQSMQFPRALYSHSLGKWSYETAVTEDVKRATIEEALQIIASQESANNRAQLQAQGVTNFRLGSLSETYAGAVGYKLLSPVAVQLLQPYLGGPRVIV